MMASIFGPDEADAAGLKYSQPIGPYYLRNTVILSYKLISEGVPPHPPGGFVLRTPGDWIFCLSQMQPTNHIDPYILIFSLAPSAPVVYLNNLC